MINKDLLWGKELILPLEKPQKEKVNQLSIIIGIAKENSETETRVALTPQAVRLLTNKGYKVRVEKDAGKLARFSNEEYANAGAEICENQKEVFASDVLFKIEPPSLQQIEWLKTKATLLSTVHFCKQPAEYFKKLTAKKVIAIGYELIKDQSGCFPLLKDMSGIAGQRLPFIATEYLAHPKYGKLTMLGGCPGVLPSKVVLVGAGTVVQKTLQLLLHTGCEIRVFDDSIQKLHRLEKTLSHPISTSLLHTDALTASIKEADVVIFAKHTKKETSPWVISEEMVKQMSAGSVIIDVSIDQGGGVETSVAMTYKKPVFLKHGVIHYCVPNITASIPHTASQSISNFLQEFLQNFCDLGDIKTLLRIDHGLRNGVYIFQGILTNGIINTKHGFNGSDINLLLDPSLG